MKYEIIVYKSPLSFEIMAQFKSPKSFYDWASAQSNLFADQVEINGQIYLGFDEIGIVLNK